MRSDSETTLSNRAMARPLGRWCFRPAITVPFPSGVKPGRRSRPGDIAGEHVSLGGYEPWTVSARASQGFGAAVGDRTAA